MTHVQRLRNMHGADQLPVPMIPRLSVQTLDRQFLCILHQTGIRLPFGISGYFLQEVANLMCLDYNSSE